MVGAEEELAELQRACTRFLTAHGPIRAAAVLAAIRPDTEPDRYGSGGVVAELEAEVADLLAKPAALFMPSGTMAQQAVLRVHADRRGSRVVVFHPMCHLDQQEGRGYQRLHGLAGRPAGDASRLLTLADLGGIAERAAALVIELPQRDLGGQQPPLDQLRAQVRWARERGAAAHLDGARLWESAAGYGRRPGEIAALFDTVYVSFYKGLGALAGCAVAGPADVIAQAAEWRQRMGGTLFGLWPNAASALTCLRTRLPLMPRYLDHARQISAALANLPGIRVIPDPPQVPMMHLMIAATTGHVEQTARRLAAEQGIWTWPKMRPTADPAVQRAELSVGDATCELTPAEIRAVVAEFVQR
ncbi:MAG TPA: beta-eliminating lyase-related protein [Streptosporangiaceae bacterium]